MKGPQEVWGERAAHRHFCGRSELSGRTPSITKLEGTLVLARYREHFAPMLAILFIGTWVRPAD